VIGLRPDAGCAILDRMRSLFHFAFHVTDLDVARRFYGGVLGCREGRSTATWVDFDFFGHQLSLHLGSPFPRPTPAWWVTTACRCHISGWCWRCRTGRRLAARLEAAGTDFVLSPQLRFAGQPGEQWTMFFRDPFGNPIEVKGFASLDQVYAA
jgi:extradiol dioxygenase family protein